MSVLKSYTIIYEYYPSVVIWVSIILIPMRFSFFASHNFFVHRLTSGLFPRLSLIYFIIPFDLKWFNPFKCTERTFHWNISCRSTQRHLLSIIDIILYIYMYTRQTNYYDLLWPCRNLILKLLWIHSRASLSNNLGNEQIHS